MLRLACLALCLVVTGCTCGEAPGGPIALRDAGPGEGG
jgi:hypothetical protein